MSDRAGQAGGTGDRPRVSRELSMLAFNARVLHEATDPRNKILDRFTFLGIVAANLDEFYMVRVAGLKGQVNAGLVNTMSYDGLTPPQQLASINSIAARLMAEQQRCWIEVKTEMRAAGIAIM